MTANPDPATATQLVVWGALVLGLVLGGVGQASRFCVRGAIADWVIFRGPARAMSWLLAVATAALALQALISLQLFEPARALPWSNGFLWLSYIVGGFIFGYGMILAAGCPQRNLVKAGQGNLRALVVLVVAAVAALMTLRGLFAVPRVRWIDSVSVQLKGPQDFGALVASVVPVSPSLLRWALALALVALAFGLAWKHRAKMDPGHWWGGIAVGLLVPAAYLLTGHFGFIAEHPETLEPAWLGTQSKRPEGLSFAAPMAHALDLLTLWSDKATVATFGVMLSLGVLAGSFASAKLRGDFRYENFESTRDLAQHLVGAVMMGFGGITAVGCSIGQGVTGLAMLSAGAALTTASLVAGSLLALRAQVKAAETPGDETAAEVAGN